MKLEQSCVEDLNKPLKTCNEIASKHAGG